MPPRTDFYLLKQVDEHTQLLTACRIIEKAYLQSHTIYICCEDEKQAILLDKLLWEFKDISFIPHNTSDAPVVIGYAELHPPQVSHDILVNLAQNIPDFFNNYQRIIEIIPENPETREKGREKYRFYRENHCELHSHHL